MLNKKRINKQNYKENNSVSDKGFKVTITKESINLNIVESNNSDYSDNVNSTNKAVTSNYNTEDNKNNYDISKKLINIDFLNNSKKLDYSLEELSKPNNKIDNILNKSAISSIKDKNNTATINNVIDTNSQFINNEDYICFSKNVRFLTTDQNNYIPIEKDFANNENIKSFSDIENINNLSELECQNISINETSKDFSKSPPWITDKVKSEHGYLKLHYEIEAFYNFIKPTEYENSLREYTIKIIKNAIKSEYPDWLVKTFGSYAVNLHLPTSDIDIVVIDNQKNEIENINNNNRLSSNDMMIKIKSILTKKNLVSYISIINARVPVIKATIAETNINVDISVNRKNGYLAKYQINKILNKSDYLRQLIYVLKYFLVQKNLNESYSGGISSFLLFNLVYAAVNYYFKTTKLEYKYITLGHLLIHFFQFYGFDFNYEKVGISVRNGSYFFSREQRNWQTDRLLCVENYQDITQDIGKSAYRYVNCINAFKTARDNLFNPEEVEESYLNKIINVNIQLIRRYYKLKK